MTETTFFLENCLERLKSGDLDARDELIARVSCRLRVLVRQMLQDYPRVARWEQADDLFQEAAIRLHRCLAEVIPATPQDFFSLAALQIRRELRDMARHYFGPEGHAAKHVSAAPNASNPSFLSERFEPFDSSLNPERLAIWTEFHAAVDRLPEIEKRVFDLLWYNELSQTVAAKMLQISVRHLRRHWQSARLKLQEQFDQVQDKW